MSAPQGSKVGETAQRAYELLRSGDAEAAERLLAPALALEPNNASALQLMGIICQSQGKFEEAVQHMRRALSGAPLNAQYHNNLGVVLQAIGQMEEAKRAFRAAIELAPDFVAARVGLIRVLMAEGEEAAADEAALLTEFDRSPQAWDLRAAAERAAHRYEQALVASEEAIRLAPGVAALRPGRALALEQLGRTSEAQGEWEKLAGASQRSPEAVVHYARSLSHGGRIDEAEAVLKDAAGQFPTDVALQGQLARLRWLKGEVEHFTDALEANLRAAPYASGLRAEAALLLQQAGKLDRAERLLREGVDRAPSDGQLLRNLSAVLSEQGRLEEAFSLIADHPSAALSGDRAVLLMRLKRPAEALAILRRVAPRADASQQLKALEALALRQLGDPQYRKLYDYERLVRTYDVAPPRGDSAEFNARLAQSLRALHMNAQHPLDQTLRNGTQTGRDLRHVEDPVVKDFLAALDAPIRAFIEALEPEGPLTLRRKRSYRISGAWSVRLKPGGFHVNHVHDKGWISSAYYVELPQETLAGGSKEGWIKFGEPPWPLEGCGPELSIKPRVGMLVLFPSYMLHGTYPFSKGSERLTAAFDVVPAESAPNGFP
jgi:tetratricopeptide (TPR) repeat protein